MASRARATGDFDAVVVGGSLAGCAAARFLALRGWRVALVEKQPALDAYKVICGHFIQAGAVPTVRRLGIEPALLAAGAVRARIDFWTRYGWIRPPETSRYSLSLRRSALDPIVRRQAAETPGVEYLPGLTAVGLEGGERIEGVRVRARSGEERLLKGRLVVAADGRNSQIARMAHLPARVRPHGRICYFSYFENAILASPERGSMWYREPDMAYCFPNEQGVTMVSVMPAKERQDEFRRNPDRAARALLRGLPEAPDFDSAHQVARWFGKIEMPNAIRPATARGMAFVGDAAQASDPVAGVGCGWAFQSAEWLAQEVGPALSGSQDEVDRALSTYARRHRRELAAHHVLISDYAVPRRFSPFERLILSSATRDPVLASRVEEMGTRSVGGISGTRRMLTRAAAVRLGLAG
jgi:2-polyprenyl-6-methoxyphenol hydroxylase-like FAD-dependent oxidoreductase